MRRITWTISLLLFLFFAGQFMVEASPLTPDWSQTATIDPYGRSNPYGWNAQTLAEKTRAGKISALNYPVTTTGIVLPARSVLHFLDLKPGDPFFGIIKTVLSLDSSFQDFKGFWAWMGLNDYPETDTDIPYPFGSKPDYPMGVSFLERRNQQVLTFSCAVCHSANLFGKPVLGMTNRFPQANHTFVLGKKFLEDISPTSFALFNGANPDEVAIYKEARTNIESVGTNVPVALGLDTALTQVVLSLAHRDQTPWAERDPAVAAHPRPNLLDHFVADSKPSVWWNAKYKTRWLTDGSVISGNPVLTNMIWNELGRGSDLKELDQWISQNQDVIEDLTTAVFATKAPKWTDYIGENSIHIDRAKAGEKLFVQNCAHCHGAYEKAWTLTSADFARQKSVHPELTIVDTLRVRYFEKTPVIDVGTDANRRQGTVAIREALNPLAISSEHGIVNEVQTGYVPPPLEGIFARYPYLHNNSIPNLCALMTAPAQRPVTYTSGKALDANVDYDQQCVGYPVGTKTPPAWLSAKEAKLHLYDTRKPGQTNTGHYSGIFTRPDGSERYTLDQKWQLIEFLKTL